MNKSFQGTVVDTLTSLTASERWYQINTISWSRTSRKICWLVGQEEPYTSARENPKHKVQFPVFARNSSIPRQVVLALNYANALTKEKSDYKDSKFRPA